MPESGGTPEQRRQEAERLLDIIDYAAITDDGARRFVGKMRANFSKFKDRTFVSVDQLFYLRDIKDKQL